MALGAVAASPELIRTLSHELRQPLSTIESIAYYLTLILPEDPKIREQLDRIQQLVEQSNWMLTSAQLLSDSISAEREPVDLHELPDLQVAEDVPPVHGDAPLRAALENLAMLYRQTATPVLFRATRTGENVLIELETQGAIPGAALSLDGARRVIEAHGGAFDGTIEASGIRVRVMLT